MVIGDVRQENNINKVGAGNTYGGLLGWDSFEQDYMGISCTDRFAE